MSKIQYPSDIEAKHGIIEFGQRLYNRAMVSGNEGNISCRVGEKEVWVTPTYESKGFMNPDMLIKMDLEGNILNKTDYKPSSEVKLHLGVFKEDEAIYAVFHAHPPFATAYAAAGEHIPSFLLPESIFLFGDQINVTKFAMPGTYDVPESVVPYIKGNKACLLGSHGALTWGPSLKDAYFTMETLENFCKIHLLTKEILKRENTISDEQIAGIMKARKAFMGL
jgi:L-fuculose-phosphate aldolase